MEIRRLRLDPHVEYFLDGASEAGEIDACTASTLRLYGEPVTLRNIVDANHPGKGWRGRHVNGIDLAHYADTILPQLPPERRGALIFDGITNLSYLIRELAKVLADWAATDETEGGAMKPFLRSRARLHRDGTIFRRTARRIHSPRWIRRYIKQSESAEARHLKVISKIAFDRIALAPRDLIREGDRSINGDLNLQLQWQREDYIAVHGDQPVEIFPAIRPRPSLTPKLTRSRHKLLKRASVFAAGLIGASTVSALARGEPITLTGPTVALQVQKRASLASLGPGQLAVAVINHSGTRLADLCIYFEKTPAIDQVTGLALWMNAGLEADIIGQANITSISKEGIEHPLFVDRRKSIDLHNQQAINTVLRTPWHGGTTWDAHRARIERYWGETEKIWTEALAVFVLGAPIAKRYRFSRTGEIK